MGYQDLTDANGDFIGETYLPDEWEDDEPMINDRTEDCISEDELEY